MTGITILKTLKMVVNFILTASIFDRYFDDEMT